MYRRRVLIGAGRPAYSNHVDNALVLEVIAGFDPLMERSEKEGPSIHRGCDRGGQGTTGRDSRGLFGEGVDARIGDKVRECVSHLAAQGAEVHEIELPHAICSAHLLHSASEASNLSIRWRDLDAVLRIQKIWKNDPVTEQRLGD